MKSAILSNAALILVGHNHPSGKVEPSREDLEVTKRLNDERELLEESGFQYEEITVLKNIRNKRDLVEFRRNLTLNY